MVCGDWDGTVSELAKMRQEMEEEIRAQLTANQAMLNDNTEDWNEKVIVLI